MALIAGGLLMAVLWIFYTTAHGPTSFDRIRDVFGRSTLFWGSLLSIPPNLLVALGLALLYPPLAGSSRRTSRIGFALTMCGLILPAGLDLLLGGGLGPPLFVPVLGLGLVMLALGNWHPARFHRAGLYQLLLLGTLYLIAFALASIPRQISDQFDGYRLYGLFAHFLTGIAWMALGVGFIKTATPADAPVGQVHTP